MKPMGFRKMTSSLSLLRQGYKADSLTKNDSFSKSIKSINGRGYKADGLTKNDKLIKSINGSGYKADERTNPLSP